MKWYSIRNIKKCNLTVPNVCKAAPISFFWAPTTNSQKCVSKFSSTWLAHQTMAFLTGQPLRAPKSCYTAGGPISHSLSTVGLSVTKAASSQPGFLTQLCFIFKDICVSHLPSPTSLCVINKLHGFLESHSLMGWCLKEIGRNLGYNIYWTGTENQHYV